jgi:hypothetical protein
VVCIRQSSHADSSAISYNWIREGLPVIRQERRRQFPTSSCTRSGRAGLFYGLCVLLLLHRVLCSRNTPVTQVRSGSGVIVHMRICPFCREEIRDEAIKYRHCQSSLLPPQPPVEPPSAVPVQVSRVCRAADPDVNLWNRHPKTLHRCSRIRTAETPRRVFGGLNVEEMAKVVGVSAKMVKRDWSDTGAWLYEDLRVDHGNDARQMGKGQGTI